ncbi:hypothetical protein QJQ45_012062 [Haematococcus lacustris]|nr:hypothetical protein QJQ45_012062 [Haematococcus lacustris]
MCEVCVLPCPALVQVYMVTRNIKKGVEAANKMRAEVGGTGKELKLHHLECEMMSLQNVVRLAEEFKQQSQKLDILVTMAGVFYPGPLDRTKEGIEQTLGINFYAPALLNLLLLDQLKATPGSRIVNMASAAEAVGKLEWDNLTGEKYKDSGLTPYGTSKLYMTIWSKELAQRVPEVDVFNVHPGFVATPLHSKSDFRYPLNTIVKITAPFLGQGWKRGAMSTIYAATQPELRGRHWGFFCPTLLGTYPTVDRTPIKHRLINDPFTRKRPSAIVSVTAHWEQAETTVSTCPAPPLLFDYGGFPPESYQLTYPAPGHPQLAKRITQLLRHTTATPQPHHSHTTATPQPHHSHTTATPQPHHSHTTATPQPHHSHTTATPQPHHSHTTATPQPHHSHTTATPQPHHSHTTATPQLHTLTSSHMARTPSKAVKGYSKASTSAAARPSKLVAAAKAYFKYQRGVARTSQRALAQQHGVSRSTLNRVISRGGTLPKQGRPTVLVPAEEKWLVSMVKGSQEQGQGVTKLALLAAVGTIAKARERRDEPPPFGGATPSKKWGQTYLQRPDRVFNADETGFQPLSGQKVVAERGAKHVFQAAAANAKQSLTCVAWGSADGQVLAPNYISAGTMLTADALGGVAFFPDSAIILKPGTHMMDGQLFPKLLVSMARQIPGGVSKRNRALLLLDGHGSRFSSETRDTAAALGFDMLIFPGQCTHFLQPWDQLFSSVKASHGKMVAGAAFHAGAEGFSPKLPQRISMVDSALHLSVGHSREPLKRAFAKTGLFPPNKKQMLEAAAASIKSGKQKTTHAAWKVLDVSPELVQAAVRRSATAQPLLYDRAVDRFYSKHELGGLVAERGAKSGRAAGLPNSQDSCRGYDHGTFVPLKVMFPEADVPVVQVSLVDSLDPERHIQVGQALAPLGAENVLLVASGSSFHNLQVFMRSMRNPGSEVKEKDQMQAFNSFLTTACTTLTGQERNNALAHWAQAPGALLAHPREEHLIPLLVAAGAAGENPGREVQVGGDISISHFLFG